jgi:hypothetical protein
MDILSLENIPKIFLLHIKIMGVETEKKIMGSTVLMVEAAVASPIDTPFLFKKYICANPPPVAKGVILEINIFINTNFTIYLN